MTETTGFVGEAFRLVHPEDRALLPPDIADAHPLTARQYARVWGEDDADQAIVAAYRVPDGVTLTPALLDEAIREHDALRAAIDLDRYGEPLLLVHTGAAEAASRLATSHADPGGGPDGWDRLVAEERATPFDLASPPLLRARLVTGPDGAAALLLAAHPVLGDLADLDLIAARLLAPGPDGPPASPPGARAACAAAELAAEHDDDPADADAEAEPFILPSAWRGAAGPHEAVVDLADLRPGLAKLAAEAGADPEAVPLAAHLAVLGMLTRESGVHTDVAVAPGCGEPLHRRTVTVPVVRAATWRDLVARAHRELRDRRERPLPDTAPPRDAGHAIIDPYGPAAPTPLVPRTDRPHGLHVVRDGERLLLRLRGEAVAPAHAARLAFMYRAVFEAMAEDPTGDARRPYLPPDELRDVLTTWAVGPAEPRGDACVPELIEARCRATPDATAVRAAAGELTFRELDERANRLARHLAALGAGPGVFVGVELGRTLDLLPAILAIWRCGAVYLPLDPELPAARRRHMVESAGCEIVVDDALLSRDRDAIDARPAGPLGVRTDPAALAYVIYTSGSTGRPKGVMVEHRGLANYLLWTCDAYASRRPGGSAVFSSISFDLGIPNLLTPLLTGEPVHLLPDGIDPADLGEALAAGGPYAFVKMTPGHLDLLSYALSPEQARDLAGIVIAAGDAFSADLAARWLRLAGPDGTWVATEYGPTEITIGNSGERIPEPPATDLVPLGAPIPNTTMRVLDERLRPVPIGVPGEICIGGVGVARGYLGHPALTADRFVPDPYGPPGSRLYRSGDIGRWLPGGVLDILGRADGQMKIRGYRVEPGEIQAAIREHPDVRDCVVAARGPGLVGYVVLAEGRRLDPAALREHLTDLLPEHMIPAAFVAIDRVPLTANGKVDARALPSPQ